MILADTSIWIDHLRAGEPDLKRLLLAEEIVCHPFVIAEIALGSLKGRDKVLGFLDGLAMLPVPEPAEIRQMIEARRLYGRGVGYVDSVLIASCLLRPGTLFWTRDRRLQAVATEIGFAFYP
ncbi:type II toxin-antitoxin system VapC family toxin (plasmid) [Acuticoccus sp. MNP-M23]|uniref:type II toxin-antitoxin system VapC family toxin n=1 Tax=Acuticoccus sp. MNP-M23 TaxID=3072793 RepID=UPI00281697B0|nr:type II toxin-antitoxin system VapC family toxin [Acuticoccus sp. MNP-M23]WMS45305.1 type II toxin-antitoxin system VapC family toxin [Acuticoccus sp. MNP-M23]